MDKITVLIKFLIFTDSVSFYLSDTNRTFFSYWILPVAKADRETKEDGCMCKCDIGKEEMYMLIRLTQKGRYENNSKRGI